MQNLCRHYRPERDIYLLQVVRIILTSVLVESHVRVFLAKLQRKKSQQFNLSVTK